MTNDIDVLEYNKIQTIELIAKTGLGGKDLKDLFLEGIKQPNELSMYLTGSTSSYDKNDFVELFLMVIGMGISYIIYSFIWE